MATFNERFLFFSTSPRNPNLVPGYLKVIKRTGLDGVNYDNKTTPKKFYEALVNSPYSNEYSGKAQDKSFAGRDKLTRLPQALGFLIVRKGEKLKITPAGQQLIMPGLFEDVMLHQLLKFQLPSPLHKENKHKNKGYFKIKPFLEILRLVDKLGYLTYQELQIFGITFTNYENFPQKVSEIKAFRKERAAIKGRKNLKIFFEDYRQKYFLDLYNDLIQQNNIKTRESETPDAVSYIKKKLSNSSDYCDAIFRALRTTGLLVMTSGRTICISKERYDEVQYILNHVSRDIVDPSMSRDCFDAYMANTTTPRLLTDDKNALIEQIKDLHGNISETKSLTDLKSAIFQLRESHRKQKLLNISNRLKERRQEDIDDILAVYQQIENKEIPDRPTMFEWNTWRAMSMIDHGNITGNFKPDDNGMPLSTASGGIGDIVGDYGNFKMVIEVTLSSGSKQYDMEGEPVPRHVGIEQKKAKHPVFGLFIAEKVVNTVIYHFFTTAVTNSDVYGGYVDIIPLDLGDFKSFFINSIKKDLTPEDLLSMHTFSIKKAKEAILKGYSEKDWHQSVLKKISEITQ